MELRHEHKLDRGVDRVKPWFMVHGLVHGSWFMVHGFVVKGQDQHQHQMSKLDPEVGSVMG